MTQAAVLGRDEHWSAMLPIVLGTKGGILAGAAVITALVGGTVTVANAADKSYELAIDGVTRTVHTKADTVRDVLGDQRIHVSDRDRVTPALDTPVKEGDKVSVQYARPITLTIDGKPRTYWTTELTVAGALRALQVRSERARLSVSRSQALGRDGARISISTPKPAVLVVNGAKTKVVTSAVTVADLLNERKVKLESNDKVNVVLNRPVTPNLTVIVQETTTKMTTETETIKHKTVTRKDSSLPAGKKVVVTKGKDGERTLTYQLTIVDGKETAKTLIKAVVTKEPVTEVVKVSTKKVKKKKNSDDSDSGASDGNNWKALARCESGGNPRAVSPGGRYHGLYQFSPRTWRSVGGKGLPSKASPAEQTKRAKILLKRGGRGQWPVCGRKL